MTTHGQLNITAPDTPILLAALGPRMLDLAGRRVQGTTVGQCGPRTIATYIAPTLRAAAEAARRPEPRIMALIRICVTDDTAGAFALARETATRYRAVPSYAAVQDKEGLADPAELHLIGTWDSDRSTASTPTPRRASPTSASKSRLTTATPARPLGRRWRST